MDDIVEKNDDLKEESEIIPTEAEIRIKRARLYSGFFMALTVLALFDNVSNGFPFDRYDATV